MTAYNVENQWGGSSAPWVYGFTWLLGGRKDQFIVSAEIGSKDHGETFNGSITYNGEGPIDFKAKQEFGNTYSVEVRWGGPSAPWNPGGIWVLSGRCNQNVVSMDIKSKDNGKSFEGTMTYEGEGPIGFKGTQISYNNYEVYNQWGGSSAPWHRGGDMIIGCRENQRVVQLNFTSKNGENLTGEMIYNGEGSIGFKAQLM